VSAATDLSISGVTSRGAARTRIAEALRRSGIETADLDARVLVCAACGTDHASLVRDPDVPLGDASAAVLVDLVCRRIDRTPVSRLIGHREFWGLTFHIDPDVLDPRSDTECLVSAALTVLEARRKTRLRILDLGIGSGAILAALLHELADAQGIGVDRSERAARLARSNLAALGLARRAAVFCGNWADAIAGRFDVVVSNPPYVMSGDIAGLERDVRDHDPQLALDGGADGLEAYRAIVPQLGRLLRPGGLAVLECGSTQASDVAALFRQAALDCVETYRDIAGRERGVLGLRAHVGDVS
jgi:release factor glutamine methyltransferase